MNKIHLSDYLTSQERVEFSHYGRVIEVLVEFGFDEPDQQDYSPEGIGNWSQY